MELNILQNQVEAANALLPNDLPPEMINIPDNESVISEDDDSRVTAVQVSGYYGRGQHTKYFINW